MDGIQYIYRDPAKHFLAKSSVTKRRQLTAGIPLHTHNFYEYLVIESGRAVHIVNGVTQIISAGELSFIRPSDVHEYKNYSSDPFVFYKVELPAKEFERAADYYQLDRKLVCEGKLPPLVRIPAASMPSVCALLEGIIGAVSDAERLTLCRAALSEVVYILMAAEWRKKPEVPGWFSYLLTEMERRENFTAGLSRLLALSHYSQEYVNRCFRRYLGISPTKYISRLRLHCAYGLMEEGRSAAASCFESGFKSYSYFYRVFKEYYGISPERGVSKRIPEPTD